MISTYRSGLLLLICIFTLKSIFAISKEELEEKKIESRKISEEYLRDSGPVKLIDNGGSDLYIETRDILLKPITYNEHVVSMAEKIYADRDNFDEHACGLYYTPKLLRALIKRQADNWIDGNRISGFLIYKRSSPYQIKGIVFLQEQDAGKQIELSGLMFKDMQHLTFGIYGYQIVHALIRGWLENECKVGTKVAIYTNPNSLKKTNSSSLRFDVSGAVNRDKMQEYLSYIVGESILH